MEAVCSETLVLPTAQKTNTDVFTVARTSALIRTVIFLFKMALNMLRPWSKLPTATVGRLVIVLWEMGLHTIAMQLQP
jgi:hypothetical protein